MAPFFDTRDVGRINLANSILTYPHEFCLKEANLDWLNKECGASEGLRRLVGVVRDAQFALAKHLPLRGSSLLWIQRDRWITRLAPTTVLEGRELSKEAIQELGRALDMQIIEEILATIPTAASGSPKEEAMRAAFACTWLTQNLAMVVLGFAKAELPADGTLLLTSASATAQQHLRRLWFSSAFEQMSLRFSSAQIQSYAALAAQAPGLTGDVQEAFARAVSVFPQHWRLPAHEGPVAALAKTHLMPLMLLFAKVVHAASRPGSKRPFLAKDAKRYKFAEVYDTVLIDQARRPVTDRIFDLSNGGLVLGTRQFAPGLLEIAESFASKYLGLDWHHKPLSEVQERYVMSRLNSIAQVEVIAVRIEKHDTDSKTAVDVDFFVRDVRHETLYAVQLKHVEYSDKGGLRVWTNRLRNRSNGLGKGIAQLEAIASLAQSDGKVRKKLVAAGIRSEELASLVPVMLHNVGVLDCLMFQEGILLYDQHTFVNVLAGRPANMTGALKGNVVNATILSNGKPCQLDNPDSVIEGYLSDPQFKDLSQFDAVADVTRAMLVAGSIIVSRGLGL